MGYSTDFTLECRTLTTNEFDKVINENFSSNDDYMQDFEHQNEEHELLHAFQSSKWSDYEVEMKKLSNLLPGHLFVMYGNGEEEGDLWVLYAKDGKSNLESAQIIYPEFDESKLA